MTVPRMRLAIHRSLAILVVAAMLSLVLLSNPHGTRSARAQAEAPPPLPDNATIVASGLINPRGFTWGPDGALYVAEAGGPPAGFMPPMGPPAEGGAPVPTMNGRISRIAADGTRTTVADGLPAFLSMGDADGPSSVAFVGNTLYAIISAGAAHGHPEFPGGVYRVNSDGTVTLVADSDAFEVANPPANCGHCGTPADELSNPYDMIAVGGKLYFTDGNKDVVDVVDPAAPDGSRISRFADLSILAPPASHLVTTGIALGPDGNFYVTNLTGAPFPAGAANVYRITPDGQVSQVGSGISAGTGVAVAPNGSIFASEFAMTIPRPPFLQPPGDVVMVNGDGTVSTAAAPLLFPGVLRWHDGALYVADFSVGSDNGEGTILRLQVFAGK